MKFALATLGVLPLAVTVMGGNAAEYHLRRHAEHVLENRQAAPTAAQPAGAPSLADTNAACQSQLAKLNGKPSNPSGKSACYSVVAMDKQTGAFQTEVYLYEIGLPTGQWLQLLNKGESISLTYPGGQVQGNPQKLAMPPMVGNPTLNASVLFTGQLNATMKGMTNNIDTMRQALMPMISIKAETADGQFLTTNMSNQEAAFINGVYSDPAFTASQAASFAATGTPFVLPGTTFGIFPTGYIVTAIWTVLFLAAVGAGTVGRYNFRQSYRRRNGHVPTKNRLGKYVPNGIVAAYDRR
jgi:hypothetical protein